MNKLLKQMFFVCMFLFLLTEQTMADSLSDAKDAYKAGNYAEAAKLIMPLAQQGDTSAQFILGLMYANGQGVSQDYKKASKWYQLSAEKGLAVAQTSLGLMYENGQGVSQDYKDAAKWYQLAADLVFLKITKSRRSGFDWRQNKVTLHHKWP